MGKYMSKEECEHILRGADKILAKTYSKKWKSNKQGIPNIFKILLLLSIVFAIAFTCMGYFIPQQGIVFSIFAYGNFGVSLILIFLTSVLNYTIEISDLESFETMAYSSLQKYFKKVNAWF